MPNPQNLNRRKSFALESTPRIKQLTDELISCSQYKVAGGAELLPPEDIKYNQFPPRLIEFVKLLPGNDLCPDCKVRHAQMANNYLTWANVAFGALICEECAFHHIHFRKHAIVLSLHTGTWTLHQVLSVLEGGNRQMLKALEKGRRISLTGAKEPLSIEMRYASREAAAYQRFLKKQTLGLCHTTFAGIGERNQYIRQKRIQKQKQKPSSNALELDREPFDIVPMRNNEQFNNGKQSNEGEQFNNEEHFNKSEYFNNEEQFNNGEEFNNGDQLLEDFNPHARDRPRQSNNTRQMNTEERIKFDQQIYHRRQQVPQSGNQRGRGGQGLLKMMKNNIPTALMQQKGKSNSSRRLRHQTDRKQKVGPIDDDDSISLFFQRIQNPNEMMGQTGGSRRTPMLMEETIDFLDHKKGAMHQRRTPGPAIEVHQNNRDKTHNRNISEDTLFLSTGERPTDMDISNHKNGPINLRRMPGGAVNVNGPIHQRRAPGPAIEVHQNNRDKNHNRNISEDTLFLSTGERPADMDISNHKNGPINQRRTPGGPVNVNGPLHQRRTPGGPVSNLVINQRRATDGPVVGNRTINQRRAPGSAIEVRKNREKAHHRNFSEDTCLFPQQRNDMKGPTMDSSKQRNMSLSQGGVPMRSTEAQLNREKSHVLNTSDDILIFPDMDISDHRNGVVNQKRAPMPMTEARQDQRKPHHRNISDVTKVPLMQSSSERNLDMLSRNNVAPLNLAEARQIHGKSFRRNVSDSTNLPPPQTNGERDKDVHRGVGGVRRTAHDVRQNNREKNHGQDLIEETLRFPMQKSVAGTDSVTTNLGKEPLTAAIDKNNVIIPRQVRDGSFVEGNISDKRSGQLQPVRTSWANQNPGIVRAEGRFSGQIQNRGIRADNNQNDSRPRVVAQGLGQRSATSISNDKRGKESDEEGPLTSQISKDHHAEMSKQHSGNIHPNLNHGLSTQKQNNGDFSEDSALNREQNGSARRSIIANQQSITSQNGNIRSLPRRAIMPNQQSITSQNGDSRGPFGRPDLLNVTNRIERRASESIGSRRPIGRPDHLNAINRIERRAPESIDSRKPVGRPDHLNATNRIERRASESVDSRKTVGRPDHFNATNRIERRASESIDKRGPLGRTTRSSENDKITSLHPKSDEQDSGNSKGDVPWTQRFREGNSQPKNIEVTGQKEQKDVAELQTNRFSRVMSFKPISNIFRDESNHPNAMSKNTNILTKSTNPEQSQKKQAKAGSRLLFDLRNHRPFEVDESGVSKRGSMDTGVVTAETNDTEEAVAFMTMRGTSGMYQGNASENNSSKKASVDSVFQTSANNGNAEAITLKAMGDVLLAGPDPFSSQAPVTPSGKIIVDLPPSLEISNARRDSRFKRGSMDTNLAMVTSDPALVDMPRVLSDELFSTKVGSMNNKELSSREHQTVSDNNANRNSQNVQNGGAQVPSMFRQDIQHGGQHANFNRAHPQVGTLGDAGTLAAANKNVLYEFDPLYDKTSHENQTGGTSWNSPNNTNSNQSSSRNSSKSNPSHQSHDQYRVYLDQQKTGRSIAVNMTKRRPSKTIVKPVSKKVPSAMFKSGPYY